jgi:ATP-dependent RNA helicase RhlE
MRGDAISLVCVDEAPMLREIERLLKAPIPTEIVAGFEPDRTIRAEPIRLRSGSRAAGGGGRPRHNRGRGAQPRRYSRRSASPAKWGERSGAAHRPWVRLPGERSAR